MAELERQQYLINISPEVYEIIQETKKGTNLSSTEVVELIVGQYFKSKGLLPDTVEEMVEQ